MNDRQFKQLLLSTMLEIKEDVAYLKGKKQEERLTPGEICEERKINRRTYTRMVKNGIITQIKEGDKPNSPVYVLRSEYERLIAEGKI